VEKESALELDGLMPAGALGCLLAAVCRKRPEDGSAETRRPLRDNGVACWTATRPADYLDRCAGVSLTPGARSRRLEPARFPFILSECTRGVLWNQPARFLQAGEGAAAVLALDEGTPAVPKSPADDAASYAYPPRYRPPIAFGAWVGDMRNSPLPLQKWPSPELDEEAVRASPGHGRAKPGRVQLPGSWGLFALMAIHRHRTRRLRPAAARS